MFNTNRLKTRQESAMKDPVKKDCAKQSKYKYKPQWGVIAVCATEEQQRSVYNQLLALGLTLKVVQI